MTPRGICQSVEVSSREGEHFVFWTKMACTKIEPALLGLRGPRCLTFSVGEGVGVKGPHSPPSPPPPSGLPKSKGTFFRENNAQEMTPKLLALAKVCSVLGNIRDVSWHLSRRDSELEKRRTFSILDKDGWYKNKVCGSGTHALLPTNGLSVQKFGASVLCSPSASVSVT